MPCAICTTARGEPSGNQRWTWISVPSRRDVKVKSLTAAASHGNCSEPMDVKGKTAVITGASRGLGAGLAEAFAARGMRLGLCARSMPALLGDEVVARLSQM